jgi:O-Antigen ligase
VALGVFVREFMRILRRGELRSGGFLGFLLVAASSSLVDVVVTATDQWTKSRDAFGEVVTTLPGWAYELQLGLYSLLLVGGVVVIAVRGTSRDATLNVPALFFLLLALLSDASALRYGDNPLRPFYLTFLSVLAATVVAPRGLGVHVGYGAFLAPAAILCGAFIVLKPEFATFPCVADKCGLLGFNSQGFFENENALALYLTLAMPFVYIACGRVSGTLLSAYLLFIVLLTGSRSGALSSLVTFALLLVVRPDVRQPSFSWPRAVPLYGVLGAAAAVGVALPLTADDPTSYTGRAYLWGIARSLLADGQSLLLGRGALGWEKVRDAGLIDFSAVYSVHNQWLQVLFSTGLVGVVVLLAGLVLLVVQAGRRYALVVGCVLVPVFCLATTERPWSIDIVDWLLWALPGALLCYPLARARDGVTPDPNPAAVEAAEPAQVGSTEAVGR